MRKTKGDLMLEMYRGLSSKIGDDEIHPEMGVLRGSVLAPMQFNVYL